MDREKEEKKERERTKNKYEKGGKYVFPHLKNFEMRKKKII